MGTVTLPLLGEAGAVVAGVRGYSTLDLLRPRPVGADQGNKLDARTR